MPSSRSSVGLIGRILSCCKVLSSMAPLCFFLSLRDQVDGQPRISLRNYACFAFGSLKPHVQCNHARGKDVAVSRARSHFYVFCNKTGSLWNWTNWQPFVDYEVNPSWVTSWWSVKMLGRSVKFLARFPKASSLPRCHAQTPMFLSSIGGPKCFFA